MSKKIIKKTTTITEEVVETSNKTLVVCILDRSGSMYAIIGDAIGGFNSFLKEQKEDDTPATMTVALFDDQYELLYNNVDLRKVKKLTSKEWSPRGTTALYDAIGKTINNVKAEIKNLPKKERPNKVLVAIVTDGLENASKEYTNTDIQKLTKKMEKKDWQFVYLAANQDAFAVGTSFGFAGGNTFTYNNTSAGNKVMFNTLSTATANYRSVTTDSADYMDTVTNLVADQESEDQTEEDN